MTEKLSTKESTQTEQTFAKAKFEIGISQHMPYGNVGTIDLGEIGKKKNLDSPVLK